MDTLFEIDDRDVLQSWIGRRGRRRRVAEPPGVVVPGVRFAFYGRTSTAEFQDPASSRAWQREIAEAVIAGHGTITDEFFESGARGGCRGRGARGGRVVGGAADADASFDAVVVGEYERAFADRQFSGSRRCWRSRGAGVAAGGRWPGRSGSPAHRALVQVLGAQSQREVVRSRHRMRSRDVGTGARAGPLPGRATAVRVSVGRRRSAPEPGARRRGVGGFSGWIRTRSRHRMCGGYSRSVWPGAAWRASRGS